MFTLKEIEKLKWDELLSRCDRINLLQTWEYGEAKRTEGWIPVRFVVQDLNGPAGLLQVLTRKFPLFKIARINRGPLLFPDVCDRASQRYLEGSISAIISELVGKRNYYLLFAPEIKEGQLGDGFLERSGLERTAARPWGSALVDLSLDKEALFKNLNGKWRNLLRKSEKMGLELEAGSSPEALDYLMERYGELRKERGFSGVSEKIIRELERLFRSGKNIKIFFALKDGLRISGVLVAGHGDSATYLIGWNTPEGRQMQANYLLLWNALLVYKGLRYRWFDVCGINKELAPQVSHFKEGLNGENYVLLGEFQASRHRLVPKLMNLARKFSR